jgi:hypothetical protein
MNSFQIHLCSKNADIIVNNNISDCIFYLPQLGIPVNYRVFISLQNASIPYSFYQVNEFNNILRYQQFTSTNITLERYVIIPYGNYTIDELVDKMNELMSAYIISYDNITGKINFQSTVNQDFAIIYDGSTCFDLFGFDKNTLLVSDSNYNIKGQYPCNVLYTNCLCIYSNMKTDSFNKAITNNKKLLCSIPIDVEPYGMITYKSTNNLFRSNTYTNNINQIEIKICDMCGNLINLNNNHWSLTLQFDLVDFVEQE